MDNPRVLELGTKRSNPEISTRHDDWVPHASEYLGSDIEDGADVDIVVDAHHLSKATGEEEFDIVISCSTFEHFKYPQLVAHEIMKSLRVDGILFIQTHQTFPLHGYPFDYYRFTREALSALFTERMGFNVLSTNYNFPAWIYSAEDPHPHPILHTDSYLNVCLYGEKTRKTPNEYIYDL